MRREHHFCNVHSYSDVGQNITAEASGIRNLALSSQAGVKFRIEINHTGVLTLFSSTVNPTLIYKEPIYFKEGDYVRIIVSTVNASQSHDVFVSYDLIDNFKDFSDQFNSDLERTIST